MSTAQHKRTAEKYEQKANKQEQQYDPSSTTVRRTGHQAGTGLDGYYEYNPTSQHLRKAEVYEEHARQHLAAAHVLEKLENDECKKIKPEVRAVCPLLGQVVSVEEVESGARVGLAQGVPIDAFVAHLRCHNAFGRSLAFKGMGDCPLYLSEITVEKADNNIIVIKTDPKNKSELLRRLHTHVVHTESN